MKCFGVPDLKARLVNSNLKERGTSGEGRRRLITGAVGESYQEFILVRDSGAYYPGLGHHALA